MNHFGLSTIWRPSNVLIISGAIIFLGNLSEPLDLHTIPDDGLLKHLLRSDPDASLAVHRLIYDVFFKRLGVLGYVQELVYVAFEVAVVFGHDFIKVTLQI